MASGTLQFLLFEHFVEQNKPLKKGSNVEIEGTHPLGQ